MPNEAGYAAAMEPQREGPLVSPKLPQQARQGLQIEKHVSRLVGWDSSPHPRLHPHAHLEEGGRAKQGWA